MDSVLNILAVLVVLVMTVHVLFLWWNMLMHIKKRQELLQIQIDASDDVFRELPSTKLVIEEAIIRVLESKKHSAIRN